MTESNQTTTSDNTTTQIEQGASAEAFTFGDPTSMLDQREIIDYFESANAGNYYEMPVSAEGLSKVFRAAVHHSSAIFLKRNILVSSFIPHKLLSRQTFKKFALDESVFGNGYLERRESRTGKLLELKHSLSKYTRRSTKDSDQYLFVTGFKQEHEFKKGKVFHLMEYDINQEIYGLPEYLAAISSALLNEEATLFRRRYYKNGSHAGFILYMTDPAQQQGDVDTMRKALKDSKGPGNFRNLFMYAPNGKKDGIQLIPVSEVASKDEFFNIKNITRDDQLAGHRMPGSLMGVVPANAGGLGNPIDASIVFARNEIQPLQASFQELNEWLGEEVVKFDPYIIEQATTPTK